MSPIEPENLKRAADATSAAETAHAAEINGKLDRIRRISSSNFPWYKWFQQQRQFNLEVTEVLADIAGSSLRQGGRLAEINEQVTELLSATNQLQKECERLEAQAERIETKMEHLREGTVSQIEALRESHVGALRNEMAERVQHLLDEQRVCFRQISLRTTEEAVLADRARRAAELRLDELAQEVAKLVKKPTA